MKVYILILGEEHEGYTILQVFGHLTLATIALKTKAIGFKKPHKESKLKYTDGCDYLEIIEMEVTQ